MLFFFSHPLKHWSRGEKSGKDGTQKFEYLENDDLEKGFFIIIKDLSFS